MKKLVLTFTLMLCYACIYAQAGIYTQLRKQIELTHPEIKLDNRLLAFNVWSVNDVESREANKSFDKAYTTYEHAKLKGGLQGIIVVAVNTDNLSSTAVISLNKDGVTKLVSVKAEDLGVDVSAVKNMVFDTNGNEVYKNLAAGNVFISINHLITR